MVGIRHKARIGAFQALCIITIRSSASENEKTNALQTVFAEHFTQSNEREFLEELFHGVLQHRTGIDEHILKNAPKFPLNIMAAVDRVILEIGIYEMLFSTTPSAIIINEAVEIAKEFGDEGTPKLVNGVLSAVMKERN